MSQSASDKSNTTRRIPAPQAHCRALIAQAVTDDDWIKAFQAMLSIVLTSQDSRARVMACRLLCEWAVGRPVSAPEPVETGENKPHRWAHSPPDAVGAD